MDIVPVPLPLFPEIRQHNALINSSFYLSTLEWRALTAILQRIHPEDPDFKPYAIPFAELFEENSTAGGSAYSQVRKLSKQLSKRSLTLEALQPDGSRTPGQMHVDIPLLGVGATVEKPALLVLVINPYFKPYLLRLAERGNFTRALALEFRKLRSGYAHKLYWLLSENRYKGERTFGVEELRTKLGILPEQYAGRFNNFKAKVLDKAQDELSKTDLAFTVELVRRSLVVEQVRFVFRAGSLSLKRQPATKMPCESETILQPWERHLLAYGISTQGLATIRADVEDLHRYTVDYINFVLLYLEKQKVSQIKNKANYVYKIITRKLVHHEYEASLIVQPVQPAKRIRPAAKVEAPVPENVLTIQEIRGWYENPSAATRSQVEGRSFEEYLEKVYFNAGFVLENRQGEDVIVKRG